MDLPDKAGLLAQVKSNRASWARSVRPAKIEPAGQGEQSVWDYPRPPVLVPTPEPIRIFSAGKVVAQSSAALELCETASAPAPYLPPNDVRTDWLTANGKISVCEWKGVAAYYDLVMPSGHRIVDAAWVYPDPFDDLDEGYAAIAGWFSFYPGKLECFVGKARATAQPGGLYGGWVTPRIKGPIKGGPGSQSW